MIRRARGADAPAAPQARWLEDRSRVLLGELMDGRDVQEHVFRAFFANLAEAGGAGSAPGWHARKLERKVNYAYERDGAGRLPGFDLGALWGAFAMWRLMRGPG